MKCRHAFFVYTRGARDALQGVVVELGIILSIDIVGLRPLPMLYFQMLKPTYIAFQLSLLGTVPNCFKHAVVQPLLKNTQLRPHLA